MAGAPRLRPPRRRVRGEHLTLFTQGRKFAAIACLAGASAVGGVAFAHAAHAGGGATDTDDSLSNKGAVVTTSNTSPLVINVVTNVFGSFTTTCTGVSATFTVPATGLKGTLTNVGGQPIQFTGCTDSLGGNDTVASTGKWTLTLKDALNDETQKEPNTGDKLVLKAPINGASLSSSIDPSCVLTLNPVAISKLTMGYNDKGKATITAGSSPGNVSAGSGCPSGMTVSETLNADTLTASIPIHDVS